MNFVVLLSILSVGVLLTIKYPAYGFICALTVFYNIGRFFGIYSFGLPGFFTFMDIALVLAFVAGLAHPIVRKNIVFDDSFKRIMLVCLLLGNGDGSVFIVAPISLFTQQLVLPRLLR